MANDDYFAKLALSSSGIPAMLKSPAHFRAWFEAPRIDSSAFSLGHAVHASLLEPAITIAVYPGPVRNGKVWDAFKLSNQDAIIVTAAEMTVVEGIRNAVSKDLGVSNLLKQGLAEQTYLMNDKHFDCPIKAKLDYIRKDFIVDIKTTNSLSEFEHKSIINYGYHTQAAWYKYISEQHDGIKRDFCWIVIEKTAPYSIAIMIPESDLLEYAAVKCNDALASFADCYKAKDWPMRKTEVKRIGLPKWMMT